MLQDAGREIGTKVDEKKNQVGQKIKGKKAKREERKVEKKVKQKDTFGDIEIKFVKKIEEVEIL